MAPTILTQGPWSPDAQHGGAPAALMGGEIERILAADGMVPLRLSFEFLRPVPLEPLSLTAHVVRPGKRMQVVDAALEHAGAIVARASGVGVRRAAHEVPFLVEETAQPGPEKGRPAVFFPRPGAFATSAMEVRMLEGDFNQSGPGKGWFRLRVPVVGTAAPTPLETTCGAADFGNGVSNWDPEFNWLFINPELTIHFSRPPTGEWILLDSTTTVSAEGLGLAESVLFDSSGRIGKSAQGLLVEPLEGR